MKWFLVLLGLLPIPLLSADFPAVASSDLLLGSPPAAPTAEFVSRLPKSKPRPMDLTGNYAVAITNREESRNLFNSAYAASVGVPLGWTGNITNCSPGTTSAALKEAVLRRLNYYRAMAGLPSSTTLDATFSAKSQEAALMMSANNALNHFPPNTWSCYTANGYEAAGNANIAIGSAGPTAVDGFIRDQGANNAAVGHRRWFLYPQTQIFGTGDIQASGSNSSANAIWVFDGNYGGPRPAVRDGFVAWPPPGFVPSPVTFNRWSFSFPGANFAGTTVAVTSNGVAISAPIETVTPGAGEETIVFRPGSLSASSTQPYPAPAADTIYQVTLNNVVIGGNSSNFTYRVTVFDPAVPASDTRLPVLSGPAARPTGIQTAFTFPAVPKATAYELRIAVPSPLAAVEGAENGFADVVVSSLGDYSMRTNSVSFSGSFSWHFAYNSKSFDETLRLNRTILVGSNASLGFRSRLGLATTAQSARVQASLNDGNSWQDIYSQAGSGGVGESSFSLRSVPLGAFAGRTVLVRFLFSYDGSPEGYFVGSGNGIGWYVDDIAFSNCDSLGSFSAAALGSSTNAAFTPPTNGVYALQVRAQVYNAFDLEWGPAKLVTVAAASKIVDLIGASGPSRLVLLRKPDGSAFLAGDASLFDVQAATNLVNPTWSSLGVTPVFSNGYLRVLDGAVPAPPAKYYRVLTK